MAKYDIQWASHLPILIALSDYYKDGIVFEFGCGIFSSPLFAKFAKKLIFVEQTDEQWFHKTNDICKRINENVESFFEKNIGAQYDILNRSLNGKADMIFVDGFTHYRTDNINRCFLHTDLIVMHDSESTSWYRYDLINTPDNWGYVNCNAIHPETAVLYNKNMIIEEDLLFTLKEFIT